MANTLEAYRKDNMGGNRSPTKRMGAGMAGIFLLKGD